MTSLKVARPDLKIIVRIALSVHALNHSLVAAQ
jgi:hypothetical protein